MDNEMDNMDGTEVCPKCEEEPMCELELFAKQELDRILSKCPKNSDDYDMQKRVNDDIMELVTRFAHQGHSGFSASYVIPMLSRLLDYKPLSPLTGEDDEWNEPYKCLGTTTQQNKRCPAVFKDIDADGNVSTHYLDFYIFSDNGGVTWFSSLSMEKKLGLSREIKFPFTVPKEPTKIYIKYLDDVPNGETSDEFVVITGNEEEINNLRQKWKKDHGYDDDED